MEDQQYSKRELEHYFRDIKSDLVEIKQQTQKTNGRVSRLENWRYLIIGGMIVISIMVIPLLVYVFNTVIIKK